MHTTEPGWTANVKQIKRFPSAQMLGQSTVSSAEVGNSVVQRCAVPQTQVAFALHVIIRLLSFRVLPGATLGIFNIWKPDRISKH